MRLLRLSELSRIQVPAWPSLALAGRGKPGGGGPDRALPLPITATAIALLLALPLVALQRLPRPRAQGLEQLLDGVTLLQSFPAAPQRAIPDLWLQRLGAPLADRAWHQQRGFWWQLWGEHVEGAPMLVLPATSLPPSTVASLPPQAMRLGDLVVVAPDPLALQLLRGSIRPQQRPSRGLQRRCLERLQTSQAVFWNSSAIGVIAGPMAPLLQRFQDGCLSIGLDATGVIWSGEAASVDGVMTSFSTSPTLVEPPRRSPLPADQLLQIQGASLDLLLQGLLSRQMIRDPLASRYGIDTDRLALLREAPFQLRLRPLAHGPFQAALELQLVVGKDRPGWQRLLDRLGRSLQEQGLRLVAAPTQPPIHAGQHDVSKTSPVQANTPSAPGSAATSALAPAPAGPTSASTAPAEPPSSPLSAQAPGAGKALATPLLSATWGREDGVVQGGWRWLPGAAGKAQLLLFLGPVPQAPPVPIGGPDQPMLPPGGLILRSRPEALASLEMLPADVPDLVKRASQLEIEARSPAMGKGAPPISQLSGRLQVSR